MLRTLKTLIHRGAKPLLAVNNNLNGTTALHLAIKSMEAGCVKELLRNSASVSIVDKRFKLSGLQLARQLVEQNAESQTKTELQHILSLCEEHEEEEDNVKHETSRFTDNVQSPNPVEEAKKHKAVLRQVSISTLKALGDKNQREEDKQASVVSEKEVISHDDLVRLRQRDATMHGDLKQLQIELKTAKEEISALKDANEKLQKDHSNKYIKHTTTVSVKDQNDNAHSEEKDKLQRDIEALKSEHQSQLESMQAKLQDEFQQKITAIMESHNAEMTEIRGHMKSLATDNRSLSAELVAAKDERRKYYNIVEDMKGKIRVFVRVRPLSAIETERGDTNIISFDAQSKYLLTVDHADGEKKEQVTQDFEFDGVFGPLSTQTQVFHDTKLLIQSAMDGYNVCIFAYGQTGSGKTFTMSGEGTAELRGIQFRAIDAIYGKSEQDQSGTKYTFSVQILELYQDQLIDLLHRDKKENDDSTKLRISQDVHGAINVVNATKKSCETKEDMFQAIELAIQTRHVSSTAMNKTSSRSHLITSIFIEAKNDKLGTTLHGKFNFIDLAGAERQIKTEATGTTFEEAKGINRSLTVLGQVVNQLTSDAKHISYRDSMLTRIMSDSIGGSAKTLMICNVSPSHHNYNETMNTLKFAQRMKKVKNKKARTNVSSQRIAKMQNELLKLRALLKGDASPDKVDELRKNENA